jgi:FemAB-related protein (PEP-CTERM system-associated)
MCWGKITICNSEGEAILGQWDAFVEATPTATVSHLYGWRKIIAESYGHKTFYLTAWREGALTGILPLVHIKSYLFGNTLVSMPFQDYGGIIVQNEEAFRALRDRALQLKQELGAQSLELRDREPQSGICIVKERTRSFPTTEGRPYGDKATLVLDISDSIENLWKSFSPKVRNQVRKAQKLGLSSQVGGIELLDEFYKPFSVNMRDLGSPVHHLKFLKQIFSVFGENARVVLVQEGAQTIGGLIALFFKNTVVVPWASCYRQYFSKCPNNLLYWDTMQYACERGYTTFDFGRSSIGSGTYNFKTQWGACPEPLRWQRFNKSTDSSNMESLRFRMASIIWKYIPIDLANIIGPCIRRYIAN